MRNGKTKGFEGGLEGFATHSTVIQSEQVGPPGDEGARGDGHEARWNATVFDAAEPAHENDGKTDDADHRRHEHFQGGLHGNEGDRDAGERAEEGSFGGDLADDGGEVSPAHQYEALDEDPGEPGLPAFHGVPGGEFDGEHDDERDDEHVR